MQIQCPFPVTFVIPACPESFFQKDSRQAGVTEKEAGSEDIHYEGIHK